MNILDVLESVGHRTEDSHVDLVFVSGSDC